MSNDRKMQDVVERGEEGEDVEVTKKPTPAPYPSFLLVRYCASLLFCGDWEKGGGGGEISQSG